MSLLTEARRTLAAKVADARKALAAFLPSLTVYLLAVQITGDWANPQVEVLIGGGLAVLATWIVRNTPDHPSWKALAAFLAPAATYLVAGITTGAWAEVTNLANAFVTMATVWLVPNGDLAGYTTTGTPLDRSR